MRPGGIRTRRPADPQRVLRSLAGLRSDSPVGFLPAIPANPQAEHALHDLRAIALRCLDLELLAAVRPFHSEPARVLDAGIDVVGYAAFVQGEHRDYAGIHANLAVLHAHLLGAPDPEVVNYDLPAFLVILRAAREAVPALAAATAALAPLLADELIFRGAGLSRDHARLIRRIHDGRQRFARFFGAPDDLNEVVAGLVQLLLEEPDEAGSGYREMMERIRAARGGGGRAQAAVAGSDEAAHPHVKRPAPRRKRKTTHEARHQAPPSLAYYRPPAAAVADRVTRAKDFRVWPLPVSIKELYEQHGPELTKAQQSWLRYARETWTGKSTMCWVPTDEDGIALGYLTQKVIDPFTDPPQMRLVEQAQEERATIATLLLDVSCSMQVDGRYKLAYMIADRLSLLLAKGEVPTEIIGHTTTGEVIADVVGRNRPLHYIVFKTREEPHDLATVHRLCAILHTGMHYFGYDGEAALWCYERLRRSRARRRVLLVVTDGDPSGTYMSKQGDDISYFTARHFRDVVALIEAEKNVEIVGVPIGTDVSGIFRRSVRIDSVADIYGKLSPYVLALLRELNAQERPSAGRPFEAKVLAHRKAGRRDR